MNLIDQTKVLSETAQLIGGRDYMTNQLIADAIGCSKRLASHNIRFLKELGAPIQYRYDIGLYYAEPFDFWDAWRVFIEAYPERGFKPGPRNASVRKIKKGCKEAAI